MSNLGQTPQYLGFGPVWAAFCHTSDRAIRCRRYLRPRIVDGKICPVDSEVHENWHTCGVLPALRRSQEDKIWLWICHVSVLHPYNSIPRIPIPRIEVACHSSSKVSRVDLYHSCFPYNILWTWSTPTPQIEDDNSLLLIILSLSNDSDFDLLFSFYLVKIIT